MEYPDVLSEIKNPEREVIELKQSFNQWEDIAETIAAFSTKNGGKIFVGIDRKGCPIGTMCSNEIRGKLVGLANNEIKPPANILVDLVNHDSQTGSVIACIAVKKGNGIFSYKGVHYERRGDVNHRLTAEEIFELQKVIKKLYFDELTAISDERPGLTSDIDEQKVANFLESTKQITGQIDVKRFLSNHGLLVDGGLQVKNAAVMLFGRKPERFFPQLKVSVCVFPSNTITSDFSKKEFSGDIFQIFQDTFIEIRRNIKIYSFVEGLKRLDVPAYPLEAIRESLINAIVHRDYFDRNTETFIRVFTDRIEILNPASFPFERVTFNEIKASGLSKRRNPIIANFFEAMKLMEQEGRGLTRIGVVMKQHGLPSPDFEVGDNTFKIILRASNKPEAIKNSPFSSIADFSQLNERQTKFITFLKEHGNRPTSRSEYMQITGIDVEKTASRDLDDLSERGILRRLGERRWTRYFLS